MNPSSLPNLEGLTDISLRRGADMRPTLLRVLTDLYVQKPTHTRDEERHYTELALRLLDSVDVPSRAAVAARLAHHLSPPARIIERLRNDLPEVAAALLRPQSTAARGEDGATALASAAEPARRAAAADAIGADVAHELNELFFAANAKERHLILLNLPIVAPLPALHADLPHDPWIGRRLEAAVLAREREEFTHQLARSLLISRVQAKRIANDELGEPIVVAAKALNVARDQLYRILLFVNTAIGHSVERVHALAALYDQISLQAAQDLLAVWQALDAEKKEHAAGACRPLLSEGGQADARL
jgi:uncharacterized protein (DUF2336 family)